MTVLVTEPSITEEERSIVHWIFSQIGRAMFLEERHIDVATALCGSGPAFACVVLEAMTDGGVMMGIPRAEAQILVAQSKRLRTLSSLIGSNARSSAYGP
jgi:pyrroline-5-carboxylate reductase